MKLSAGTVAAQGERFWTLHLLKAAIRPMGWVAPYVYCAEVMVGGRWLEYRQKANKVGIDCAQDPEIIRIEYENLAHNELRCALITA